VKVLVDALPLRHGGGVTYLQAQLAALARVAPELDLHTLVSPWSRLDGLPGRVDTVRVRGVAQRYGYELGPLAFRRADVLYCPANFGPVRSRTPTVVTIHNPNYYRTGLALAENRSSRPRWKVWANHAALRGAAAVVAISESLADEVSASLPSLTPKIVVIPSGATHWTAPAVPLPGLPERYLLTIASPAPHKRVVDVVAGWAAARSAPPLVVIGPTTESQRAACRSAAGARSTELHLLGQVSDRGALRWAFEHASALVSMSLLEAFPLTPGEAGSVGCPLVLSDIPPHREVTMGNATFVPVRGVADLAEALSGSTGWVSGSRPWDWPVTWDDNARALRDVLERAAR
jgi:glycosyltransferase involved in cell wall biosynthesis